MSTQPHTTAAVTTRRQRMANCMTEAQFLVQVRDLALLTGWIFYHTRTSIGSDAGFPDVVITNPRQRRTIFAELKKQDGVVSADQKKWLASLAEAGNEVAVWRPADLDAIKAILTGRRITTTPKEANTQ